MRILNFIILFVTITSGAIYANDCFDSMGRFFNRSEMKHKGWAEIEPVIDHRSKLTNRLELGEISQKQFDSAMKSIDNFKRNTTFSLMGDGMNTCFDQFSDEATANLVELIIRADNAKDTEGAFAKLVKGAQEVFGDNAAQAKLRICGLSDGGRCQIFSKAIGKHCK